MRKLLIADSSEPFTAALADALGSDFEIQICADGETALELLLDFHPDVLILNLQLPYKDGLTVLQEAAFLPKHILATASYLSHYAERRAASLGVTYFLVSPAVATLRVRVMDMVQQEKTECKPFDLQAASTTHLHILNFPTHTEGYRNACVALPLFFANPDQVLNKVLYPEVAKLCGGRDHRAVERCIRDAITAAWKTCNRTVWHKYFPPDEYGDRKPPSNKKFFLRLTQILKTQKFP